MTKEQIEIIAIKKEIAKELSLFKMQLYTAPPQFNGLIKNGYSRGREIFKLLNTEQKGATVEDWKALKSIVITLNASFNEVGNESSDFEKLGDHLREIQKDAQSTFWKKAIGAGLISFGVALVITVCVLAALPTFGISLGIMGALLTAITGSLVGISVSASVTGGTILGLVGVGAYLLNTENKPDELDNKEEALQNTFNRNLTPFFFDQQRSRSQTADSNAPSNDQEPGNEATPIPAL